MSEILRDIFARPKIIFISNKT